MSNIKQRYESQTEIDCTEQNICNLHCLQNLVWVRKTISPGARALCSFVTRSTTSLIVSITKERARICLYVCMTHIQAHLAPSDRLNGSHVPTTWHKAAGNALTVAKALLIDWCRIPCADDGTCPLVFYRAIRDQRRRSRPLHFIVE